MRRVNPLLLVLEAVSVLLVGTLPAQVSRDFKMSISSVAGWPVDFENGFAGAQVNLCAGKSNLPSGGFTCSTAAYYNVEAPEDWAPDPDCTGGVKSEWIEPEVSHLVHFDNGDLMYWVLDKTAESYACYDPAENSFMVVTHFQIIGGSGRYKGASGTAKWELPMVYLPLGDPAAPLAVMATAYDGIVTGTVTFGP